MDDVKLPEIDAKQLEKSLREEFERCIATVVRAMDGARIGAIIDDSEEPVRQTTAQVAFSPSAPCRRRKPPST